MNEFTQLIKDAMDAPRGDPTVRDAVSALRSLIELEHDLLSACTAALARDADMPIGDRSYIEQCGRIHSRHISELGVELAQLGEPIPTDGDYRALVTEGDVLLGAIVHDGVAAAVERNVGRAIQAYERSLDGLIAPSRLTLRLTHCLADLRLLQRRDAAPLAD